MRYLTEKTGGNIHDNGTIFIESKTMNSDQHHPKNLVDYNDESKFYHSQNTPGNEICFDFKDRSIQLTDYTIKSYCLGSNYGHLKDWVIEVSNDKTNWIVIDNHSNDQTLNGSSIIASFQIQQPKNEFYRYVKLRQTGYSWDSCGCGYYIYFSFIEFFGKLRESSQIYQEGPYTKWKGVNKIEGATDDRFGNALGSQYDLAEDGNFKGYTVIMVLQYTQEDEYSKPIEALKRKGFDVKVINSPLKSGQTPLQTLLTIKNSQLWFISRDQVILSQLDIDAIKNYFLNGHGVYIWGDNDPYFTDANRILENIFGSSVHLSGNDQGEQVLGIQKTKDGPGIVENHLISTGIVNFYEGITISSISCSNIVKPLVYSSVGKVVTSFYDKDGKRLMIDGGFTRLYSKFWNTAGTNRLIVNAAAWLANTERFGYHPQK